MDQPLDLSQRDTDSNQQAYHYPPPFVRGSYVQYNSYPRTTAALTTCSSLAPCSSSAQYSSSHVDESKMTKDRSQKRVFYTDPPGEWQNIYHAKRQRTEDLNSGILYRAVSDNRVGLSYEYDQPGGYYDGRKSGQRTTNVSPYSSCSSSVSNGAGSPGSIKEVAPVDKSLESALPATPTKDVKVEDKRDVIKSIEYMERLPKKRFTARHLSLESARSAMSSSPSNLPETPNSDVKIAFLSPGSEDSDLSSISRPSLSPCSITTSEEIQSDEGRCDSPVTSSVDFNSLKADMIREIEDEKKRESSGEGEAINQQFNSFLYNAKTGNVPATYNRMRVAAVEYLLSKSMNPNAKKNAIQEPLHSYQLGRLERPGKLSLLDMVELQVEIGLA